MPTRNLFLTLICGFIVVFLTACSDDKPKEKKISFNHAHSYKLKNLKKHTFEHKFASQCVTREMKNPINKNSPKKQFEKPCLCIAKRIMRDLTTIQAEKFLLEKKHTHSLKMSFDEAAYFCIQHNAQTKVNKK